MPPTPGRDESEASLLRVLRSVDWSRSALSLSDPLHQQLAALAIAEGGIACHPFANFYVFTARPAEALVQHVNQAKGRPLDQTGSVVTTPEHIPSLFDWAALPAGLERERVLALIQALLELGPFGFRGPAAADLPPYLTAQAGPLRTVQVVSPGFACPSNRLFAGALARIPQRYLYGTSANRSRRLTGAADEPVHYELPPLQAEFGRVPGFFMLAEGRSARAYGCTRACRPACSRSTPGG